MAEADAVAEALNVAAAVTELLALLVTEVVALALLEADSDSVWLALPLLLGDDDELMLNDRDADPDDDADDDADSDDDAVGDAEAVADTVPNDETLDDELALALTVKLRLEDALPLDDTDDVSWVEALDVGAAHMSSGPSARSCERRATSSAYDSVRDCSVPSRTLRRSYCSRRIRSNSL